MHYYAKCIIIYVLPNALLWYVCLGICVAFCYDHLNCDHLSVVRSACKGSLGAGILQRSSYTKFAF